MKKSGEERSGGTNRMRATYLRDVWLILNLLAQRRMTAHEIRKRTGMRWERMMEILMDGADAGFIKQDGLIYEPGPFMVEYGNIYREICRRNIVADVIETFCEGTVSLCRQRAELDQTLNGIDEESSRYSSQEHPQVIDNQQLPLPDRGDWPESSA